MLTVYNGAIMPFIHSFHRYFGRLFPSFNERQIKNLQPLVNDINALEPEIQALDDEALRQKTTLFREQIHQGKTLDDILVPAFAVAREAAFRVLKERPYDVQLMGAIVLHRGLIAEMKTGEGKTLASVLPSYLNALSGKPVHVVTVNDYLARRDAEWMGRVYNFLGLRVGSILHDMEDDARREAYAADVTYGTNNEFGFDYLRDHMKFRKEDLVQRGHAFAIVDEVDSILIDEARTPLIISGAAESTSDLYKTIDVFIPDLQEDDFDLDEKARSVTLTEKGNGHMEDLLRDTGLLKGKSLYDIENVTLVHHVTQALRAHKMFVRDRDYIVKNGQVVIVDEFTGRMMEGRRYSGGLHQAIEAREKVAIQPENQTLASITFQNYFRLYKKLSGMTGTAMTEEQEFMDIYGLAVVEIPTNLDVARVDDNDQIYRTQKEKDGAILSLVKECQGRQQPVLIGTTSIEKSENLSAILKKNKIPHNVLNARYHEQEAKIIAEAGGCGVVTIATNMAGRGTDIQLGGNVSSLEGSAEPDLAQGQEKIPTNSDTGTKSLEDKQKVIKAGGLTVIGTERHESRRIDNQLRGRSGRQGDPGKSIFFLSLEDDLMRIFGSDRMNVMLQKLGLKDGEAIFHPWVSKAIEKAQRKVEGRNFDARKNILKFDNVTNEQRQLIFEQRQEILKTEDLSQIIESMRYEVVMDLLTAFVPQKVHREAWDLDKLHQEVQRLFAVDFRPPADTVDAEEIDVLLHDLTKKALADKMSTFGLELANQVARAMILQNLDKYWREHLSMLDHLRQVVGLRGYGQKDPLNEYKREAFQLFEVLLTRLRDGVMENLMHVELREPPPVPVAPSRQEITRNDASAQKQLLSASSSEASSEASWGKVARNAPCPCNSGKKYKFCHGSARAPKDTATL